LPISVAIHGVKIKIKEGINKLTISRCFYRITIAIAIISLLSISVVVGTTPPATGYELTLYHAYPFYFWFLIATSIASGILIFIRQAFESERSNWWVAGLIIIVVTNSILLTLPFFRGYAFFPTGDAMTHIGMMKDIIKTGYVGVNNFYPIVHILGVTLMQIAGLNESAITFLLIVSWNITYLLGICILARVLSNYTKQAFLIIAFACPLVFSQMHVLIHPSMLSLYMVPLLLYCFHRSEFQSSNVFGARILLLLLAFLITYTHPMTCLYVIALLTTLAFVKYSYTKLSKKSALIINDIPYSQSRFVIPILMLCVFFIWYFSYAAIQGSIRSVYEHLIYDSGQSLLDNQLSMLSLADLPIYRSIILFINRYGAIFLTGGISLICALIVLKNLASRKKHILFSNLVYAIIFIVSLFISGYSLLGFTVEYSSIRVARYFLIIAPIISGLVIYRIVFINNKYKLANRTLIATSMVSILVISLLSMLNIYGSPYTLDTNWQVSQMEINGSVWLINNKNEDTFISETLSNTSLARIRDYNFGVEARPYNDIKFDLDTSLYNLGYDEYTTIAETFKYEPRYILISESKKINQALLPESAISKSTFFYDEHSLAKLKSDSSATFIYSNDEQDVYLTNGN